VRIKVIQIHFFSDFFIAIGRDFERANYTKESLQDVLTVAQALHDDTREQRIQHLITTAEGRYDFSSINLNSMVNIIPQTFRDWLVQAWRQ
jgi:hypothetical protein